VVYESIKIGNFGQETLNNIIKMYELKSSGILETCEECAITKAWQKNVSKNQLGLCNVLGKCLYIDFSSIKF
jgi:endonuclease IV